MKFGELFEHVTMVGSTGPNDVAEDVQALSAWGST